MSPEFRKRFFTPVVLPLAVVGFILLFALSFSRLLLALPELASSAVALLMAGYILFVAAMIVARPRISARALGIGLAFGMVGLVAAGGVSAAAGMRPLHEEEAAAEGEGGDEEPIPPALQGTEVFVAVDIAWEAAPPTLPAGEVELGIWNQGATLHNLVIEELGDEVIIEAAGGETDSAAVTLEPGQYTYFCSVPGHREAGMVGTVDVEDQ